MVVHVPAAGVGLQFRVRSGVQLGKELFQCRYPQGQHPGLIAIITGTPVTFLKSVGNGDLGELFSISENTKFRFSSQHLASANNGGLARPICQPVI